MPGLSTDRQHNLPIPPTRLVGRERELLEVRTRLCSEDIHLLTLTGPGGIGKTRLALQVAANLLGSFADGVYFINLVVLVDADLVPSTVAHTFGLESSDASSQLDALKQYLHAKELLLVFDNFEHLQAAAPFVSNLLADAPNLRVLVTSRAPLHLSGEHEYPVPPLSLPPAIHLPALESLSQYEAVALFIQCAVAVKPSFQITPSNASAVAEICRRLDGIPLAIELAASRIKALSAEQIATRLDNRFRLLTGGARTALPRHQTLRATIDWSYNLLADEEKTLFRSLSVFSGSWTLDAAEQVCGAGDEDSNTLDLLTQLIDKSLVTTNEQSGVVHYHLLETTRQYAREKLNEAGEAETVLSGHFAYFLQFAESAESRLNGPDQAQWLDRLERDHDNFRAALEWSLRANKDEQAVRLAGALGLFWFKHTHYSEGRRWLASALERNRSSSDEAQVKAWRWAGFLAFFQGDFLDSRRIYTQNLEREQTLGDQWGIAFSLHMLANVSNSEGNREEARELHQKSIALSREIDATWVLALAQFSLGYVEQTEGNLALAGELYEESLSHSRRLGEKWGMFMALENIGYLMCSREDFIAAKEIFLEALNLTRELGQIDGMIYVLNGLASVFQNEGMNIASARLQGLVVAKRREFGIMLSLEPVEQESFDTTANALKAAMGAQAYQSEFEAGMALTLDDGLRLVYGERSALGHAPWDKARAEGQAMSLEQAATVAHVIPAAPSPISLVTPPPTGTSRKTYPAGLSAREVEVLRLIADGLTDAQVAEKLVLSPRTVNAHLQSIYNKIGVNSRLAATRFAVDNGLL